MGSLSHFLQGFIHPRWCRISFINSRDKNKPLQVEPGKPGAEVSKNKTISQRKNLPIECAQGDRPARCPNHFFAVNEPSAVPWW